MQSNVTWCAFNKQVHGRARRHVFCLRNRVEIWHIGWPYTQKQNLIVARVEKVYFTCSSN
jgi:hypothetical protein